jgi:hypothetical protein
MWRMAGKDVWDGIVKKVAHGCFTVVIDILAGSKGSEYR